MKKIPRDANWHYLKWLGIFLVSIVLLGIVLNFEKSLSVLSLIFNALAPILIGIFIAVILNVPVNFFEKKVFKKLTQKNGKIWSKIKRAVSIVLSISLFLLVASVIVFFITPRFIDTCKSFISEAPEYMDRFTESVRSLSATLHLPIEPESINFSWDTTVSWLTSLLGNNSTDIFQNVVNTAINIFTSVWNICMGFILAIYIVASKEKLTRLFKSFMFSITTKEKAHRTIAILRIVKKTFEDFIAGQCLEVICIGLLTFFGMLVFQFPHAAMISCIIAIMAFIPIFGAIAGALAGAFIIFLISPLKALWFLIFIIILQQIESNVIYPKIMGHKVGLPSLWILFSVMLGGGLFGIFGIIICVPLCSVAYVLFNEWLLKRLRERKLCKQNATEIPTDFDPTEEKSSEEETAEEKTSEKISADELTETQDQSNEEKTQQKIKPKKNKK